MQDLVILCGGRGTRLGPITNKTPKPLLRFSNEPFIDRILRFYQRYNFKTIYLLAGYKGKEFKKKYHNTYINYNLIKVIIEKKPLGTGGALNSLRNKITKDFLLVNADSFFNFNLLIFNKTKFNLGKMLLIKNTNYRENKKLSHLDVHNNLIVFKQKNYYMNSGVYIFNKKIFKFIPKKTCSLENDILPKLIERKKINGYKINTPFIDMGTKKNFNKVQNFLKQNTLKPALFLDRDGVLNKDYGYVHKFNNLKFLNSTLELLKIAQYLDIYIIIITNQSGIGRKLYSEKDFHSFQKKIKYVLSKKNIFIDDVYYCPHHPAEAKGIYKKKCKCRKPNNQMVLKAKKKWNIDFGKSLMIGDSKSDEQCAKKSKIKFYYINQITKKKLKSFFNFKKI